MHTVQRSHAFELRVFASYIIIPSTLLSFDISKQKTEPRKSFPHLSSIYVHMCVHVYNERVSNIDLNKMRALFFSFIQFNNISYTRE